MAVRKLCTHGVRARSSRPGGRHLVLLLLLTLCTWLLTPPCLRNFHAASYLSFSGSLRAERFVARSPFSANRGFMCGFAKPQRVQIHASGSEATRQIEVLYDGLCRVCLANKAFLESQDSEGKMRFVNIAGEDYKPSEHGDVTFSDAMDEFHVIMADGEILRGTDAVLGAYEAVGLQWAVSLIGNNALRWLTDRAYKFLSQNRRIIDRLVPGGERLRENVRSAMFLQKGVAEGEGCSGDTDEEEDEDDDCTITEERLQEE